MFTRQTSDPGNAQQECVIRVTATEEDFEVFEKMALPSDDECTAKAVRRYDDDDGRHVKERSQSVGGDDDSPSSVRHTRRKKHSFARMVDQKLDLDFGASYGSVAGDKTKDGSVPHIEVEESMSQRARSVSFSLLSRCRSGSESSDIFTPYAKKVNKDDLEKDLRHTKSNSLLSTPSYDFLRRASDTNIKDEIRRVVSPATTRKEVYITSVGKFPQYDKYPSAEGLETKEDTEGETSPIHSFTELALTRKQQRISLPFIKFSETESEVSDDNDVKVARRVNNRTKKHTYTRMSNVGIKSGIITPNKLIVPTQNSVISENDLTFISQRSNGNEAESFRNSADQLTIIGEHSIQEYNLDYDLDTMRKKSCFVLTNRTPGEPTASEPENLSECTNLVKAIEFAAFEINEAHSKKKHSRRSSCPTKLVGEDITEHTTTGEKRWRKKSFIGKLPISRDCGEHHDDMKKILDEFKDSEIIISNIDRLAGRRGGVSEKCKIERQLVKHAVKHLMKNAVLAQAL